MLSGSSTLRNTQRHTKNSKKLFLTLYKVKETKIKLQTCSRQLFKYQLKYTIIHKLNCTFKSELLC